MTLSLYALVKKISEAGDFQHCSLCGTSLTPSDEEGICHLCKISLIFNEDMCPDLHDFAC